jgi:hypothetical protein
MQSNTKQTIDKHIKLSKKENKMQESKQLWNTTTCLLNPKPN